MMNKFYSLIFLIPALCLVSCLRDDIPPCPGFIIEVGIADRNFDNAFSVEFYDTVDDSTPFDVIVRHMYVRLQDLNTGAVVEESAISPSNTGLTCELAFNDSLPTGKYIATVWANVQGEVDSPDYNWDEYNFNSISDLGDDVFVCHDTIDYQHIGPRPRIDLKRVKGRLVIDTAKMPQGITETALQVSELAAKVDYNLGYSGSMSLTEYCYLPSLNKDVVRTFALLPPSANGYLSSVSMRYYSGESLMQETPKINVKIERNKITRLYYEWSEDQGMMIYVNIDGTWERVTSLNVSED